MGVHKKERKLLKEITKLQSQKKLTIFYKLLTNIFISRDSSGEAHRGGWVAADIWNV